MLRCAIAVLALICGVLPVQAQWPPTATPGAGYEQQVLAWRTARVARLTAADGWLSLVGLDWLKHGANRIGTAAHNDIVLAAGPSHLGVVTVDADGGVHIDLAAHSGVTIDGRPAVAARLIDDRHVAPGAEPTRVAFGTTSFHVIDRDGRKALRVRDSEAPTRRDFLGIDYFPIDPSWHIEAEWVPFDPPHPLQIGSVIGTIDTVAVPGKAVFLRDGRSYELLPYQEEPGGPLFFVIADRTSGKQTYGAARFFYAELPRNGKVTLDFNEAYNPPCAFTPFATCPLAPPENRLDLEVTAGEKNYRGSHH